MTLALQDSGYGEVYHMRSVNASERDVELWKEALEAKYQGREAPFGSGQWDSVLGHCNVVLPACVLTVRQ